LDSYFRSQQQIISIALSHKIAHVNDQQNLMAEAPTNKHYLSGANKPFVQAHRLLPGFLCDAMVHGCHLNNVQEMGGGPPTRILQGQQLGMA
jgi:hypothetical protein